MQLEKKGVTAPKGFAAAYTGAGIKYENRNDMALIYSSTPCEVAGTFTKNIVKAAPVKWDQQVVASKEKVQVVVINAGVANACTGEEGMQYCRETADEVASCLLVDPNTVLVASTGVIGKQLPMMKIKHGIQTMVPLLNTSIDAGTMAAKAIMTTDTKEKEVAISFELQGRLVTIGGMCKGSGMIHPDMCTMLSFVTTDILISKELLEKALLEVVEDTYNMISVDGDTSTNDTVLLMANGLAENPLIDTPNNDYEIFVSALKALNTHLAKEIAGDGEGATALFEVKVVNAKSVKQAKCLAKSVITSNLTKAAIFGHDANWGRILCAMGYSGVDFDPETVDLYFESEVGALQIIAKGVAIEYSEEQATHILSCPKVTAIVDLHQEEATATAWGCDLTYDYIKINADYRS